MKVGSQNIPTIILLDREIKTMIKYGGNHHSIMLPSSRHEHNLIYMTWAQNRNNISSSSSQNYWVMIGYWSVNFKIMNRNKMWRKEKKENLTKKKEIHSINCTVLINSSPWTRFLLSVHRTDNTLANCFFNPLFLLPWVSQKFPLTEFLDSKAPRKSCCRVSLWYSKSFN